MALLLDFDPIRGVACHLQYKEEDGRQRLYMTHTQDVSPILKVTEALANDEDYTKQGIKQDQWHYARIPDVILQDMKQKHGADWYDKNDKGHKKFFQVLNHHYPKFKTTAWNHE